MSQTMEIDDPEDLRIKRDNEIGKLLMITEIIASKYPATTQLISVSQPGDAPKVIIDLDASDELAGILATTFTAMRKKVVGGDGAAKFLDFKATIGETETTIRDLVTEIENAGITLDFMMATPLMNLLTCFKAFFDEVRTGVTKFTVREEVVRKTMKRRAGTQIPMGRIREEDRSVNISAFGLTNQHIPLLQGITLAPERRTGLMRSLGPMAQAILLVNETTYPDKLSNALKNSLAMLPMNAEITNCLRDARTPGAVQGVLCELGDVLTLSTARSTQKIYMPLLLVKFLWSIRGDVKWNFAGAKMLSFISTATRKNNIHFRLKSGGSVELTSQAVFHAMYGTYLEDLGILAQITTYGAWKQRKELNPVFSKRATKSQVTFKPITFTMVSKMAQALLTQNMGNVDPCYATRAFFSGIRNRTFSTPLVSYLKTGRNVSSYSTDPLQLQMSLKKVKDELIKEMDNGNLKELGTTKWLRVSDNGDDAEVDIRVTESGISFYGSPQ